MTDRVSALVVVLDENIRVDDVEPLVNAIRQLKHVIAVEPNVTDYNSFVSYQRVRSELGNKLWEVLYPKVKL